MDYYFRVDSQKVEGPISAAELAALRAQGRVASGTQVRPAGTDEWRSYEDEFPHPAEVLDTAEFFDPAPPLGNPVEPPALW